MATKASPTLRRRQLGRELKAARETSSLTPQDAADVLSASVSTVYRIESGGVGLKAIELTALLDRYGITDQEVRTRLERLRAEGRQRGWWSGYRSALKPSYQTYIGLEDSAVAIRSFAGIVIPGPLQTAAYARAVMMTAQPPLTDPVISQRVEVRMQRQGLITRAEEPLRFHVVLDEAAVQRRVGGDAVWQAQLEHLVELAKLRHITVQVLPFDVGTFAESAGEFSILDFDEGGPVAYVESLSGDLYAEGDGVERFLLHFDALRTAALPPTRSVGMIEGLLHSEEP